MHKADAPPRLLPLEFDFLTQNAPVSIMFANAEGVIEFVNDWHLEHMALNNRDRAFFLGKHITELPGIISSGIADQIMEVYTGKVIHLERVYTPEFSGGQSGYQTIRAAPVVRDDKVCSVVFIRQEVTSWVESEKRIKEEKRRMRALLNATTDSAILIDPKGTFIALNSEAAKRRGKRVRDLLGANLYEHLAPESSELRRRMVARVLETRQPVEYEETDSKRTCWVSIYPVFDANGALTQLASFSRDITERKLMEQRLIDARHKAEASYMAKTQFLANISHELRTPLNGILGAAQVAKEDGELSQDNLEMWDIVRESGERLLYTVNALLDLADIESHALQPMMKDFSLRQTVESVLESFQVRAKFRGLILEAEISPDVPQVLVGDEFRLRQIIINLVNNAIQSTVRGFVRLRVAPVDPGQEELISAITCLGALTLKFTVEDSGVGIPPERLSTLFDSFSIAEDHLTKSRSGSGVGLSISRSLVEIMGGKIGVTSTPGSGSTFIFTACFWSKPHEEEVFQGGRVVSEAETAPFTANILLVEDERINRVTASRALSRRGFRVTEAMDGEQALLALLGSSFDVVLMDIQMPVMDGLKATQLIRNGELPGVDRNIPIIALTAYASEGDRLRLLRSGMDGFVPKPYKIQDLVDAMVDVLDSKAALGAPSSPLRTV